MTRTSLVAFCLSIAWGASAAADPATTSEAIAMRAAPSAKARLVQRVPANAEIDLNHCSGDWCYASWRDRFGYLPVAAIASPAYPAPPAYGPPPPAYGAWSGGGFGPFYYGYGWSGW
jgi:hypothetical protein